MELLRCCNCQEEIERRRQNPNQKFCKKKACQNARKRLWKVEKRVDPGYRKTEQLAQQDWRRENPGYMTEYREEHPDYVAENRRQQRRRNGLRGDKTGTWSGDASLRGGEVLIVNGDASKGLGDKGFFKNCTFSDVTVIVNGDASNPLVPMLLVPLDMLQVIVKETRQGANG